MNNLLIWNVFLVRWICFNSITLQIILEYFTITYFTMFCFSFIDVSHGKVFLYDKSSLKWKKFCFSNVTQLLWSPNELCDKNHFKNYF